MLRFDRKQPNSVMQSSFNKNKLIKKKKKENSKPLEMSIQALLEGSDNIFLRVIKEDVGKQETSCS